MNKLQKELAESHQDTSRIHAFLKLGDYYLFLPGEKKNELDSALNYYDQAIRLSNKLHSKEWIQRVNTSLSSYYFESGDPHKGAELAKEAIRFYHAMGNKRQEAFLWEQLGGNLIAEKPHDHQKEGLACYDEAFAIYNAIGEHVKAIATLSGRALVHFSNKNFDEAEKIFLRMHKDFNKVNYFGEIDGTILDWLAYLAQYRSDNYRAHYYALENLDNLRKHPKDFTESRKAFIYLRLSSLYRDAGIIDKSEYYARKGLAIDLKEKMDYSACLNNLINALIAKGEPKSALSILQETLKKAPADPVQQVSVHFFLGDIYAAMHLESLAEQNYLEAIEGYHKLAPQQREQSTLIGIHLNMAKFYASTSQFMKASSILSGITAEKLKISPLSKSKIALVRSRIDSASGNYLAALKSFHEYKKLTDTIFNIQKSHQLVELEVSSEMQQKQDRINLLSAQNHINLANSQKAKIERNITFVGIVVALVFSGIILYSFTAKLKVNKILTSQQLEINKKNESLQVLVNEKENLLIEKEELLADKDMLLKEVHHRVKNNLQIVMSLLSTQLDYLENKEAVKALEESQQRIQAIALIHQKLYRDKGGIQIDMRPYIADMVDDLNGFFNAGKRKISFDLKIDPIYLDIEQAVPVGLILNEAMTNCIKYAFRDDHGSVRVVVKKTIEQQIGIIIADDGKGLPKGFDSATSNTLGMEMMKGLSKQLSGTFNIVSNNGVEISLSFPYTDRGVVV